MYVSAWCGPFPYLLFFLLCGDSQVVKGERLKSVSHRSSGVRLPFPAFIPGNDELDLKGFQWTMDIMMKNMEKKFGKLT